MKLFCSLTLALFLGSACTLRAADEATKKPAAPKAEETTTVTVTPKDAAGVTTLLNGTTESFTITATSTATA
ncbi:MAG: hypothetical protein ACK48Y_10305, partial [Planctomyces sp.]